MISLEWDNISTYLFLSLVEDWSEALFGLIIALSWDSGITVSSSIILLENFSGWLKIIWKISTSSRYPNLLEKSFKVSHLGYKDV